MYPKSHREMMCTQRYMSLWLRYIASKHKLNLIFLVWNFFLLLSYHIIYAFQNQSFSTLVFIRDRNIIEISIISICNSHNNRYHIWNTLSLFYKKSYFLFSWFLEYVFMLKKILLAFNLVLIICCFHTFFETLSETIYG